MSMILNAHEVDEALRPVGRYTVEHAFHTDILIDIRPVYSFSVPDKSKVRPLRRCRFG